jgi:prefoldin subunit 5
LNPEAELRTLLVRLRDVEQRAEMHREQVEALQREAEELRERIGALVKAATSLGGTARRQSVESRQ